MVTNSGGPRLPSIRAPPGHIIQPIHDDNGSVVQFILRPQHPNMPPNVNQNGPPPPGTAAAVAGNRMQPPHNYHYQV